MPHDVGEATGYNLVMHNFLKVYFPGGYELRIIAQIDRDFRHKAVRNVQLFHNGQRIAQYDGIIERTPPSDPFIEVFNPHQMVLGEAAVLAAYWQSAVRFVGRAFREYKREKRRNRNNSHDEAKSYLIVQSATVAGGSEHELKMLLRHLS